MLTRPGPSRLSTRGSWWLAVTIGLTMMACSQSSTEEQTNGEVDTGAATAPQTTDGAASDPDTAHPRPVDAAATTPDADQVPDVPVTDPAPGAAGVWLLPGAAGERLTSDKHTLWLTVPASPVGALADDTHRLWLWAGSPRPD